MLLFLLFFMYFKIYLITYIIDVPLVATLISLAMGCIIYIFSLMEDCHVKIPTHQLLMSQALLYP